MFQRRKGYSRDVIFKEVKNTSINEDEPKEKGLEKMEFEIMNEGLILLRKNYMNQMRK